MQLKPIVVITVLLLAVAVSACDGNRNQQATTAASYTPTSTVSQTTVSVSATSLGSTSSLTDSYGVTKTPATGYKFVKYAVYFQNINAKGIQMGNAGFFKLRDTEGNLYSYDPSMFTLEQQVNGVTLRGVMPQMNTQIGDKYSGLIVFQVPQSATLKSLTYDDYANSITINL
jgi:hypothetical protein